jgi:hypothetical protein
MTPSNPSKQPAKPNADEVLHNFAVSESLSETQLCEKLKRKVITADEYDDRLVENYHNHKAEAKHQMADDLISMLPEKHQCIDKSDDCVTCAKVFNYNLGIDQATETIRAYFGVNGEGE